MGISLTRRAPGTATALCRLRHVSGGGARPSPASQVLPHRNQNVPFSESVGPRGVAPPPPQGGWGWGEAGAPHPPSSPRREQSARLGPRLDLILRRLAARFQDLVAARARLLLDLCCDPLSVLGFSDLGRLALLAPLLPGALSARLTGSRRSPWNGHASGGGHPVSRCGAAARCERSCLWAWLARRRQRWRSLVGGHSQPWALWRVCARVEPRQPRQEVTSAAHLTVQLDPPGRGREDRLSQPGQQSPDTAIQAAIADSSGP